ncbi:denticleless protein homolog B isoform X1 [Phalaenopsis equestris]|uniref:denticleless protein homolog B isoform X1 n=1 Tax=Phalaenopsis equestris TaxID=78828 RepID=UPI0009E2B680|nr:denticleless protein homolog B isoform X1 [Phalaenopsis equestris]
MSLSLLSHKFISMAQRPSCSSSFFGELRTRELSGFKVRQRPYLGDLLFDAGEFIIEHENNPSPPLALSFCKNSGKSHILAVSDEEGFVSCYDTRKRLRSQPACLDKTAEARVSEWVAHENAIFDICWIKDDSHLLTASGDQTIKIWNAERRKCIGLLAGHTGSVKSISSHSSNSDLFVSGSRDGSFAIWDLRCKFGSHGVARVLSTSIVKEAHSSSQGRRTRRVQADSKSVTCVLYLKDDISIASAGAVDSVVKFWDSRNLKSFISQACPNIKSFSKKEKVRHGISSLSQDSCGVLLSASCMDNRIYLYDVFHLSKGPQKIFNGSKITSFYVKSAISPDGSHILSGSGDGNAYIWRVNKPESVPFSLKGHEKEVTAVAWCSTEVGKLATSSDDYMVHVWNINKDSCISSRSPLSMRKRVAATPSKMCRKLNLEDSDDFENASCALNKKMANSPSPLTTSAQGYSTPESLKKRKLGLFPFEGLDLQKSPDPAASFDSPSSVLNLPSSSKRKTIRDYFLSSHLRIKDHLSD